ncbi:MAG: glycosyltransferase family 39 protein, partial [Candidatus Omnitrophica bacterium]|nr:glycosyltransferase family 39 protein [Candidatus Omnitrophota bacterium]
MQLFNLRYVAAPYTDEGIYLYSAKLITQGYLPYRDFILTHPPLAIFLIALFFKFWDERLFLLRIFYALFIQTAIFPLFILVKKNTKSIWAALTAVALFSTFVEFMHHDARFFALRQCEAVIFIYALFIFFLFESNFSQFFAGFLLGTGISLTFAHILIVIPFFIGMFLWQKKNRENFFIYRHFLYGFSLSLLFLILVFIIPRAWDCLIKFQLSRPRLNLYGR